MRLQRSCVIIRFLAMKLSVNNDAFFTEVEQLLAAGQSVTLTVRGGSMMPWLRDGRHSVVVCRHSEADIMVGNVLFFVYGGQWVMHRLRRIEGDKLYFAGDGNYRLWECVGRDAVRGVVRSVVMPSGRVMECDGFAWCFRSKMWLMLPALVRRYILGVIRRLKL